MVRNNRGYANRGKLLEEEIRLTNNQYKRKSIAVIQQIATPVKVMQRTGNRVTGFFEKKSTLDYRGTLFPGISISFDCKENTKEERGLPLTYIQEHQVKYMREALEVKEVTFIICYMATTDKRYLIPGEVVIHFWNRWQQNKGKRGYNYIPVDEMLEIKSQKGFILDYISVLKEVI